MWNAPSLTSDTDAKEKVVIKNKLLGKSCAK